MNNMKKKMERRECDKIAKTKNGGLKNLMGTTSQKVDFALEGRIF